MMSEVKDFASPVRPTWCPGCGNFGILNALKKALASLDLEPHQVLLVSGIGCGSKLPDYIKANGFHGIHGRALPIATGAKLANHELKVVAVHGDGDGYGIGGNHFLHTMRRNIDLVDIVQNNQVYGLTKGQYSPTSERGFVTKTSPEGVIELAVNPIALALVAGATFVSRGFAGDPPHLAQLIAQAIEHRGHALVDVLQPCVIFNRVNTYDWFRARVYKLEEEEGYDPSKREAAWRKAFEWGDRIPIGLFYQVEGLPTYEDQLPALRAGPLVKQGLRPLTPEEVREVKQEFI
ncbi:MAG: 2-oxoacid:ferredoxin oxidoreductase subunit beta [Anaerolineae bacterium]